MTKYVTTIILIFLAISTLAPFVRGETIDELTEKIEETKAKQEQLEKEIKEQEQKINVVVEQKQTLSNTVQLLDTTKKKLDTNINLTQTKISGVNSTISDLEYTINKKLESIKTGKQAIAAALRQMATNDNQTLIELIASEESLSSAFDSLIQLMQFREDVATHITQLKIDTNTLNVKQDEKEQEKTKLVDLTKTLDGQKKSVEYAKQEKAALLKATANQEAEYRKVLEQKLALKEAFERELFDYESKLERAIDPGSYPDAKKGILSWPLESVYITQTFGITSASKKLYSSGAHNGVDFRASIGTKVLASSDGVVAGTGDTDLTCKGASFGKWILIKYDNGLATTYAHLSVISVKRGDRVSAGSLVGFSGNSGYSTGPHLHVSLYPSQAVEAEERPSLVCGGKVYNMPIAPLDSYLDPLAYYPSL